MNLEEAVALTEKRLPREGNTMADLLSQFRNLISPVLIDDQTWARVLTRAGNLPITMGAQPFGFEFPLHTGAPVADLGVTLTNNTSAGKAFLRRDIDCEIGEDVRALTRLFALMDAKDSRLRKIVGRKLMLEYDIGSAKNGDSPLPGIFVRPDQLPIFGAKNRAEDVRLVAESIASSAGWQMSSLQLENLNQAYLAQSDNIRTDSFGVFPSRSRAIRLAAMGFESRQDVDRYLGEIAWPGCRSAVDSVIARFQQRMDFSRTGLSFDVQDDGIGPALGLTLMVKQRYTNDPRYWLDDMQVWHPFLDAISQEDLIFPEKIQPLAQWVAKPTVLFGNSGRFVLLRGIHHIKLVIRGHGLTAAKAYTFLVLSTVAGD